MLQGSDGDSVFLVQISDTHAHAHAHARTHAQTRAARASARPHALARYPVPASLCAAELRQRPTTRICRRVRVEARTRSDPGSARTRIGKESSLRFAVRRIRIALRARARSHARAHAQRGEAGRARRGRAGAAAAHERPTRKRAAPRMTDAWAGDVGPLQLPGQRPRGAARPGPRCVWSGGQGGVV